MSDLIDRQAAIDRIRGTGYVDQIKENVIMILMGLPSAQPEIIRCGNCKHWTRTCGDEQWGLGDCDVFDKHLVMCNGYCAWAERREE